MKNKHKLTLATACLAVAVTAFPLTTSPNKAVAEGGDFSDVPGNAWYASFVHEFVKTGIVNGFGDGSFHPDDNITRSQFVQILYKVMGQPNVSSHDTGFSDANGGWYVPALAYAKKNDLLEQFPVTGVFEADRALSRGEAARLLWNLIGYDDERKVQPDAGKFPQAFKAGSGSGKSFGDQGAFPGYAKLPIEELSAAGVLNGYGDGTFKAERAITRAEATKMLDTALRKVGYADLVSASVTQSGFIQSMYGVLSKASTMEGYKIDFSTYNGSDQITNAVTKPDGGGYTAEKVGIRTDNPNGQVTAAQAADWLGKWAMEARNISFKVNVSSDPFEWAQINGWFDGTSVKSRNDVIQREDLDTLNKNLHTWLVGYRLEGHTVYFHWPMVPYEPMYGLIHGRPEPESKYFTDESQIRETMKRAVKIYNQAKVTVENGQVNYYEELSDSERVIGSMGVYGDRNTGRRPDIFRTSYEDFSDAFPINRSVQKDTNYYFIGLAPCNIHLVSHGGYASIMYSLQLDSSQSVATVQVGKFCEADGSIPPKDGNILTNYRKMAFEN